MALRGSVFGGAGILVPKMIFVQYRYNNFTTPFHPG
jgi:hypothetical protein